MTTTSGPEVHTAFLGSLISGIFARKQAKKNAELMAKAAKVPVVTSHTVDLAKMNQTAIDNGYHPMTLLNAGGLSAFTTTSTTGMNAMAAAAAQGAVPSMGSVFSGALSSTIDAFAGSVFKGFGSLGSSGTMGAEYFPPAPSKGGGGMAAALGWDATSRSAGGGSSAVGASYSAASRLATSAKGAPMMPSIEAPETTNPWRQYNIDPTVAGAEAFETRYGDSEIASTLAWGLTGFDDLWYNVTGMTSLDRNKKFGQPVARAATNAFDTIKAGVMSRPPASSGFNALGKAVFEFVDPWFGPSN